MSSLVKSQKTHVSHRSAAESRLGFYAVVAQLEEHAPDKREVVRSGLTVGTTGEGASAFDLFNKAPFVMGERVRL